MKAFKMFQGLWLYFHLADLRPGRALPAPVQQFIQLLISSGGNNADGALRQVLYKAAESKLQRFGPGALPVINALHLAADGNGNGLLHVSELYQANDLFKPLLVGGIKLVVVRTVHIQHRHHFTVLDDRHHNF